LLKAEEGFFVRAMGLVNGMVGVVVRGRTLRILLAGAACAASFWAVEPAPVSAESADPAVEARGGVSGNQAIPSESAVTPSVAGAIVPEGVLDPASDDLASLSHGELAAKDPRAFLRRCREVYLRSDFQDYSCKFIKQELIGGRLTKEEQIEVNFRRAPYSVSMHWVENAIDAEKVIYVAGRWVDRRGREMAWIKPAGALIKLVVPKIQLPLEGDRLQKSTRRGIHEFGFGRTLDLIIKYVEKGFERGELELKYLGVGRVDGRKTFVFERVLPYTGREEPYPDALFEYHIDQEWLVPTACLSYADVGKKQLLGSYVSTEVRFNVGLTEAHFDPKKVF
jgi:hypothetical protein